MNLENAEFKLYEGIKFSRKVLEENKAFHRRQQEATVCFQKYRSAREKNLEVAKGYMGFYSMVKPGAHVSHMKMGEGRIEAVESDNAVISFADGTSRKFNMMQAVLSGFITMDDPGFAAWSDEFSAVMTRRDEVRN